MKILVAYGSSHGSTAEIARRIADRLRALGAAVVVADVRALAQDASGFDAVIVGGRVWGNGYPHRVSRFIRRNLATLRTVPSAFFSVCLWKISHVPEHQALAGAVPRDYLEHLGFRPDIIEVFAGSLSFTKYRFGSFGRKFMRRIWTPDFGPLDTTRDHSFTDWVQVESFALRFWELLQQRGVVPVRTGETRAPADRDATPAPEARA